jgi:hypothetical protein
MILKEIKYDIKFVKNHTLQPRWWKIIKIFILCGMIVAVCLIFGIIKAIIWFSTVIILSSIVHIIYRSKTNAFTKTWMDFKIKEVDGKQVHGRIGWLYYSLVVVIFTSATLIVFLMNF